MHESPLVENGVKNNNKRKLKKMMSQQIFFKRNTLFLHLLLILIPGHAVRVAYTTESKMRGDGLLRLRNNVGNLFALLAFTVTAKFHHAKSFFYSGVARLY